MGNEKVYGPSFPCPCGKGEVQFSRTEHDTYPARDPDAWGEAEITCPVCAEEYVPRRSVRGLDNWYFIPKAENGKLGSYADLANSGFQKIPNPRRQ